MSNKTCIFKVQLLTYQNTTEVEILISLNIFV